MDKVHHQMAITIERFFEFNDDGCLLFDRNGSLTTLNATAATMFGFGDHSWQGRHFEDLLYKKPGSLYREIGKHLKSVSAYRDDVVARRESGETFEVELRATLLDGNGGKLLIMTRPHADVDPETHSNVKKLAFKAMLGQVATGVLHNIGNLLNSINISTQNLVGIARDADVSKLIRANNLFLEHREHIQQFIESDPTGRYLPEFYAEFGRVLDHDHKSIRNELSELQENLNLVKELIATQQDYARHGSGNSVIHVRTLLEDAMRIEMMSFDKHGIRVEMDIPENAYVYTERPRALHVLLNLIKNGKDAILSGSNPQRRIAILVSKGDEMVHIRIKDNGIGIKGEHLARMFAYGFTTKLEGHGFGLYTSLEAVKEMKGELTVNSNGPGTGAEFTLSLPAGKPENGGR